MIGPNNKARTAILFISFIAALLSLKTAHPQEAALPEIPRAADKTEYKSENLRDPFQQEKIEIKQEPQEAKETKPLPALQIQGIVWGGSFPQAIINNKVVRVGDMIEGVRITDISKSGVKVFFDNRNYNLTSSSPTSLNDSKNNPQAPKN